ncbi:hypothetical protein B6175_02975 [Staphylococcus aureus]|nr:hypothetical protein B6175_02975 [Staphylococcus aureus]
MFERYQRNEKALKLILILYVLIAIRITLLISKI